MIILIALLSLIMISIVYFTLINGISPMPSSVHTRKAVMEEIKKHSKDTNQVIIDAGSGWGTLAFQTARLFPSKTIIGIENSHIPYWISRMWKIMLPTSNLSLFRQDIYKYSYRQTDIVLCYLYPGA